MQAFEPGGVALRSFGQFPPALAGQRALDRAGLGVSRWIELRLGGAGRRCIGVLTWFDPHGAGPRRRVQDEVDTAGPLHPQIHQRRHGVRVGVESRLVGSGLPDDPAFVAFEEAGECLSQFGMGPHGRLGLLEGGSVPGQVEQVAGDDQDPGTVPGVEGPGQLTGEHQRGGSGLTGEQEVAHHHDPTPDGDVDDGIDVRGSFGARSGFGQGNRVAGDGILGRGGRCHL